MYAHHFKNSGVIRANHFGGLAFHRAAIGLIHQTQGSVEDVRDLRAAKERCQKGDSEGGPGFQDSPGWRRIPTVERTGAAPNARYPDSRWARMGVGIKGIRVACHNRWCRDAGGYFRRYALV